MGSTACTARTRTRISTTARCPCANRCCSLAPLQPFFWPPGYPLLVALASFVVGPTALAGQAVSLVMGALVPVFTALLVREVWPRELFLAVLAGLLVAVCGQLWQSSIVVMADTTGLALATLGAWALVRYANRGSLRWLLLASAALAYATLARWIYGLVGVPFALYALRALPRAQRPPRAVMHAAGRAGPRRGHAAARRSGRRCSGLLSHPSQPASFAGNLQVYSWSPLNALRHDFFTADGHLEYAATQRRLLRRGAGEPGFLRPIARAVDRRRPVGSGARVAATNAGADRWLGGHRVRLPRGAPWQNFRFTLAYLPPLAILAAAGLIWTWRHVTPRVGVLVVVCGALGVLTTAAGGVRLVDGFIARKNDDLALVRWVAAQTPPGAQLLSFGPTLAFRHYTSLPTFDLFDLTPADV